MYRGDQKKGAKIHQPWLREFSGKYSENNVSGVFDYVEHDGAIHFEQLWQVEKLIAIKSKFKILELPQNRYRGATKRADYESDVNFRKFRNLL